MAFLDKLKKYGSYALGGAALGLAANKDHRDRLRGIADESQSAKDKRRQLEGQGSAASQTAGDAERNYGALGSEAAAQRAYLQRIARGQESVSAEQLRQGLQQNLAAQRSLAAGAAPANAAMAARTAAIQSARLGSGLAGQQAIAGMQERQAAQTRLAEMLMQQRGQDAQVLLGSRGQAINAYGGITPEQSDLEKMLPFINAGAQVGGLIAKSDERAKRSVRDGDDAANRALEGLRAVTYRYKDERDGRGRQVGAMAQNLEKVGLGHAVEDTPGGKMVHGAKLALGNTAMLAALAKRVKRLEGEGK